MLTNQNIEAICQQLQPEFNKILSGDLVPYTDQTVIIDLFIDREVLEFFKSHSTNYQLMINNALRLFIDCK